MKYPLNQITESLKQFGVSDQTRSLLLVRIGPPYDTSSLEKEINQLVEGVPTPLSRIVEYTDWAAVKKVIRSVVIEAISIHLQLYTAL